MEGADQNRKPLVPKGDASCFIFTWLTVNFEEKPGELLLRQRAYDLYVEHCKAKHYEHTSLAAFGKHFKRAFPSVGAKRLSRDGLSKKRYYAGVAYNPRPASAVNPTPRPAPSTTITWVEENAEGIYIEARERVSPPSRRKRTREKEVVSSVDCRVRPLDESMPTTADDDEDKSEDGNREEEKEGELVEGDVEVVELERAPARSRVILSVRRTRRDATNTMITFDQQQAVVGVAQKTVTTIDRAGHHLCMMNMFGYYSQVYTKELWGINPINPATTDIQLLAIGAGSPESTTLALNSCLLMSSASFLVGHWQLAKDYFHKARLHLGDLFDTPDYDIACVLLPLSWWSRVHSKNHTEGLRKQNYYVTLGQQICESVDALNDETYRNFTYRIPSSKSMRSVLSKMDPTNLIEASMRKQPYRKSWQSVRGLTYSKPDKATSIEIRDVISKLYSVVYPICAFYHEVGWDHPGWAERTQLLKQNLGIANRLEEALVEQIQGDQSCTLSDHQYYAAKEFVRLLLMVPPSIMVMTTHEFTTNDYMLIRLPVDILVETQEKGLLTLLYETLIPYTKDFYWMRRICKYVLTRVPNIAAASSDHIYDDGDQSPHPVDLPPFTSPGLGSSTAASPGLSSPLGYVI